MNAFQIESAARTAEEEDEKEKEKTNITRIAVANCLKHCEISGARS